MRLLERLRGREREAREAHEGVSCDPKQLYADGGFYDDDPGLRRLLEVSRRARRSFKTIAEVYPRAEVDRPPPASIDSSNPDRAIEIAARHRSHDPRLRVVPPSLLVRVKDALLWHGVIFVQVDGRFAPLYELHRHIDRPLHPANLAERIARETIFKVDRSRDAAFLYVGSAGTLNYGHWLVDDLPALAAVPILRARYRQMHVITTSLGPAMDATRDDGVAVALGGAPLTACRFVHENYVWRFDELHYVTPATYHPMLKNPAALTYLRSLLAQPGMAAAPAVLGPRLFVNRSAAFRRRLLNEDEIVRTASSFGFREVFPERMSPREQWLAFGSARQVVGLMGAGMTNTLFMPPGSEILHLAFEGWPDPFFWDLAAMAGQSYRVMFGSPPVGASEGFLVDPDMFARRLREMTGEGA